MNEETIKLFSSRRIIYTGLHILEFMTLMEMLSFMAFCIKCQSQTAPSSFCRNSIVQTTPSWFCLNSLVGKLFLLCLNNWRQHYLGEDKSSSSMVVGNFSVGMQLQTVLIASSLFRACFCLFDYLACLLHWFQRTLMRKGEMAREPNDVAAVAYALIELILPL